MLNAETITDGASKSTSREEVFVRPLIEAAVRLIQNEKNMKKLDGESVVITYCASRFSGSNLGFHKTYALQIVSRGKTVLDVVWDDEPNEKPLTHKFRCGDWEETILSASPRFH